jgi:hypothetical protein
MIGEGMGVFNMGNGLINGIGYTKHILLTIAISIFLEEYLVN